jgi:N-acetylneuraminic acid mutarotase
MDASARLRWWRGAALPRPRAHCAVAAWNGGALVAGGTFWEDGEKRWSARADWYDPAADRWEQLPPLPAPHAEGACLRVGGELLIVAGGGPRMLSSGGWSWREGAWRAAPDVPSDRPSRCPAAAVLGSTAYLFGGFSSRAGEDSASARTRSWTAGQDRWRERTPMPGPPRFWTTAVAAGGRIFLVGGATWAAGAVRNLDDVLAYDPRRDRWSTAGRLPQACRGAGGLAAGGEILVLGGYAGGFLRRILAFDPRSGGTRAAGALPRPLAFSRFLRLRRRALAVTGEDGDQARANWTPILAGG